MAPSSSLSVVAAGPRDDDDDEECSGAPAFEILSDQILSDLAHMERSALAQETGFQDEAEAPPIEVRLHGADSAVLCNYGEGDMTSRYGLLYGGDYGGGGSEEEEEEWRDDPSPPHGKRSRRPVIIWTLGLTLFAAVLASTFVAIYYLSGGAPADDPYAAVSNAEIVLDLNAAGGSSSGDETNVPTYAPSTFQPTYLPTAEPTEFEGDLFLFSGQSNVIGSTTGGMSLTGDEAHWGELRSILKSGGAGMKNRLFEEIESANAEAKMEDTKNITSSVVLEVMELYDSGLLDDIDQPLEFGHCSFRDPKTDGRKNDVSGGTVPMSWDAGCGYSFGPEFTFGRYLELERGYTKEFEAVKTAVGGTRIFDDWHPDTGTYWPDLRDTIANRKTGNWKAFVWYQGENDSFTYGNPDEDDTTGAYLGNLTALVDRVRLEMFEASAPGTWECPRQIPTVVVQLARWPGNAGAERIRNAQAAFCENDPRAALVTTNDLSPFYHLDPASFLIMGRRVGKAYEMALEGAVSCPGATSGEAYATSDLVFDGGPWRRGLRK